jgi:anti-anti-sigma factor
MRKERLMDAQVSTTPGGISIAGEMTIYCAAALKVELFAFMQAATQPIQIDLAGVTALDTAGLQILLMLRRVAEQSGVACEAVNLSAAVTEVMQLCGLHDVLSTRPVGVAAP